MGLFRAVELYWSIVLFYLHPVFNYRSWASIKEMWLSFAIVGLFWMQRTGLLPAPSMCLVLDSRKLSGTWFHPLI